MRLESVNVGLPQTVTWRGQEVTSSIWKSAVRGRRRVDRLNVDGDAQADRVGHGGEYRAVFVYQVDAYRYWERELDRRFEAPGQFGENFTVEGLADDEVRIGDRFRIGAALFEVTQPRVTCFKVGIRLDEPRMPALLTGHGRPGFYLRVLEEGDVGAGDEIRCVSRGPEGFSVKRVSDLLYTGDRDASSLRGALAIEALAPGWKASFSALLEQVERGGSGNAGLVAPVAPPAWPGFRGFQVAAVVPETESVRSFLLEPSDGGRLPAHLPGQSISVRLPELDGLRLVRSYSLSATADGSHLRISVKRDGRASTQLHDNVGAGATLDVAAPRGSFVLDPSGDAPVALISAGIGVTPVLAMLAALADAGSRRPVTWIHVARSGAEHAFAAEADALLAGLPQATAHVRYTRPRPEDQLGRHLHATGRLTRADLDQLGLSRDAEAFLCGPPAFVAPLTRDLEDMGLRSERIRNESFGGRGEGGSTLPPHIPASPPASGPLVTFARSGIDVRFDDRWNSLLELAEACDVPADWSCRTGVCHRCENGLIAGAVHYDPEPLERPGDGALLLCCATPSADITLDL